MSKYLTKYAEVSKPQGAAALCSRGQLCPFLIEIELIYHPNNFASDVRNVINESELIIAGCQWSLLVILNCRLPGYYILFVHIISYFH